jgi:S1 RNA binding domain protein
VPQDERAPDPSPASEANQPVVPESQHKPDPPAEALASSEAPAAADVPVQLDAEAADAEPATSAAPPPGAGPPLPGPGDVVEATVRRIAPFGAFVRLADGRKGLIHISQIAQEFVSEIKEHVKIGDVVRARITAIGEDGKVDLSIKKALPRPRPQRPPRAKRQARPGQEADDAKPPKRAEQFHVNPLADLLADVEKKLK